MPPSERIPTMDPPRTKINKVAVKELKVAYHKRVHIIINMISLK